MAGGERRRSRTRGAFGLLCALALGATTTRPVAADEVPEREPTIRTLLATMSLGEKIGHVGGTGFLVVALISLAL